MSFTEFGRDEKRMSCLFCGMVEGTVPCDVVFRDRDVLAIRDIRPQAPTHILVIPTIHVESVDAVEDPSLWSRTMDAVRRIARELHLHEEGYRLVVNCGALAGQTIPHLHIHLLAGRPFRWPPG